MKSLPNASQPCATLHLVGKPSPTVPCFKAINLHFSAQRIVCWGEEAAPKAEFHHEGAFEEERYECSAAQLSRVSFCWSILGYLHVLELKLLSSKPSIAMALGVL